MLCAPSNQARLIGCYGWTAGLICTAKFQSSMVPEPEERAQFSSKGYPLPWPHHFRPIARRSPLLHRLAGQFLIYRGSKRWGSGFSTTDFLLGVADAVKAFTKVLNEKDRYHDLKTMLSPSLYNSIKASLDNLPEGAVIDMDVSAIKGQTLCSVNAIFGDVNPDDEHSIEWLGQKVLTSKSRMMQIIEGDSSFTFRNARVLGAEATLNRLEFILGVSFFTRTWFKIVGDTGQTLQGHDQYVDEFHFWKFSSLVDRDKEYPFEWIITDINNFL